MVKHMVMDHRIVNSADNHSKELLEPISEYMQLTIELMQEESEAVLAELMRMENILGDAATQLRDSFTGMDNIISRELESLPPVADTVSSSKDEPAQSVREQLADQYRNSIMALQFEDIVIQMIGHSRSRARELDKILADIRDNLANLNSGDTDAESLIRSITASRQEIEKFRGERLSNNPVNQGSLDSGDIELF
jgi:hypothetical protein